MQKRPLKHELDYSRITPSIFLGTNACCHSHFDKMLLKKGIKADISLEKERLDSPLGVDYFLWLPVKDHKAPKQKQLLLGAAAIDVLASNKIKIMTDLEMCAMYVRTILLMIPMKIQFVRQMIIAL